MNYVVADDATADLDRIWHYIEAENPEAADRLLAAARKSFEAIARNPEIGSQRSFRRAAGIRSRQIRGFETYLVFYRVRANNIEILRVLHEIRDLPRFFKRP